jgi:hypothetical protein
MLFQLPPIPDAERTPLVEALLAILDAQQQRIQQLEETVQQLRDEIALLKGEKPRPKIAPSQLEKPPPKPPLSEGQKRPGSEKRAKNVSLAITDELVVPFQNAPDGSVHLRYEEYIVQELVLQAKATRYLRERIQLPDGSTLLAALPADVLAGEHFGPELIAYLLYQYHQCNVTQPLLLEQLQEMGIDISAGQISHILTENHEEFHREKAAVLKAVPRPDPLTCRVALSSRSKLALFCRAVPGLAGSGNSQRWGPTIRSVVACVLLDSCGTALGTFGALQREPPRGHRAGTAAALGTVPGPEEVSRAARPCGQANVGSPFRCLGQPEDQLSRQHRPGAEGNA